jgi:hypothetical protein
MRQSRRWVDLAIGLRIDSLDRYFGFWFSVLYFSIFGILIFGTRVFAARRRQGSGCESRAAAQL